MELIAQAVDHVVTNDSAAYFSATGNDGNISYESANINFVSDTIGGITGNFYDFDPSDKVDTRQRITIPNGDRVQLDFQWDDPFYTTNGVDTDLNIYLINATTGEIVASSFNDNISSQTPLEDLEFENTTGQTDFDVAIELFDGPEPGRIKYIPFGLGIDPATIYQEFATNSPTIFGQPAATNASAVAAAPYFDQKTPEDFTSVGPTTILFEPDGTRKTTPEIRQKPDITAVDGTDTTFFGDDIDDIDGNGFPNFFGTSAAAPHAAAVAALVKQANPEFTPQQIYDRLESTAEDIGAPGRDNVTGVGLINAYDAVFGPVVPATLNFTDDFEDGNLPIAYETNSNGAGRIQVTSENNPIGDRHLTLDSSLDIDGKNSVNTSGFGYNVEESLNEVILNVNTTNFTDVKLSFDQREFRDGDNPMPEKFVGSNNSDGVALSVDGTKWYRLISLTGDNSPQHYENKTFDLTKFAADNNLTLGEDVQIKFQQFDDLAINTTDPSKPSDGMAFDNISVTGSALPEEPKELISGTPGDDLFIAGVPDSEFDGKNDILFTGAGNDEVDTQFVSDAGGNRINTASGDDIIFVSQDDDAFAGVGNDIFDATDARGDNRMSGEAGDDIFFLGQNDRALGGEGDDQFYVQSGGDNLIAGGAGNDQFWIVSGEIPESANTITDFEIGEDVIGILGAESLGISSDTLELSQVGDNTSIDFGDQTLAILSNTQASLLDTNNTSQFIFA